MTTKREMDPVDWISAGAIGDPGDRTFYLQARKGEEWLGVVVEKQQVAALAHAASQLLASAGAPVSDDVLDAGDLHLEPVVPEFRVGAMGLGSDPEVSRVVLQLVELPEEEPPAEAEPETVRLWLDRDQLASLVADAAYAVQGGREVCVLCSTPLAAGDEHVCLPA